MGRTIIKIKLSEEEKETLEMWVGSHKAEQRMVKRARVILLSDSGMELEEISRQIGLSTQACSKWRKRFMLHRLEGLRDKPGRGRACSIPNEKRLNIQRLACTKPHDGSNRWTVRKLEKASGVSSASVHRILNEGAIKPHKIEYWCGKSPDPEFEEKQAAIIGLYLDPPDNAVVICVDEKSHIQALDRTQPELPLRSGNSRKLTSTYKRHGTTCLLAALSVHDGVVEGRCVDRHTHKEFLNFLKCLYRANPGKHLHIIVDNFSAHKHKKVIEWVSRRRRLTLHFTPTYASWLNQIEIWLNIFTREVIRGGIWHSKKELVNQIMYYIRRYSKERAKPFRWTYTGKPLAA